MLFHRRAIWFVVLTTCFALMLVQTQDRLNYYLVIFKVLFKNHKICFVM